ncbi:MAG: aspartate kinase [Pseudomonadota bacterium]
MSLLVVKFGGTSLADLDRIRRAAQRIKAEIDQGHQVIAIVSAMAGQTNRLAQYCTTLSPIHDSREYDLVVASGEQVTAGLMAIALQTIGVGARSYMGWQIPIRTDDVHGRATISSIETDLLKDRLQSGEVPIIPGFQGLSPRDRVTTLGRGGSDTTAVALAAGLSADRCDIYTDVAGVFTADPRLVPTARQLDQVAMDEMLELASQGAKVLHPTSVALAVRYRVPLHVRSSFSQETGTLIMPTFADLTASPVRGLAHSLDEARLSLIQVPDRPGIAAQVLEILGQNNLSPGMILQTESQHDKTTDMTLTLPESDLPLAMQALHEMQDTLGFSELVTDEDVCKVSVIGNGIRTNATIAAKTFATLAREKINIQAISTSEICISVLISKENLERALTALHETFELNRASAG